MRALLGTVLIAIGLDVVIAAAWLSRWDHVSAHDRLTFDPTGLSLLRVFPAQLAIGVLGVLIMGSEYATGQIRATLGATPQRGTLLAAKTAVFTVVVFVRGLVTSFVAFFIGQAFFSTKHAGAALSDPGALRAVIGRALYLAAIGTLARGLGTILRRTAGGIFALVGLLLVRPILVGFLPSPWSRSTVRSVTRPTCEHGPGRISGCPQRDILNNLAYSGALLLSTGSDHPDCRARWSQLVTEESCQTHTNPCDPRLDKQDSGEREPMNRAGMKSTEMPSLVHGPLRPRGP